MGFCDYVSPSARLRVTWNINHFQIENQIHFQIENQIQNRFWIENRFQIQFQNQIKNHFQRKSKKSAI